MGSIYCFVSLGSVHCVPVNTFNEYSNQVSRAASQSPPEIVVEDEVDEGLAKIKNKNLLYTLNNPSVSDIDSDSADTSDDLSDVINNYNTHSLYLPTYSIGMSDDTNQYHSQIKDLLQKVFYKAWTDADGITIKRLTGGITNMLLQCSYAPMKENVLMRVYGPGTNLIIDRHREFILHLVLNSIQLAPPVYSRFKNGLVYGFLEGRSLEAVELENPNLYPLIAQQLGNWHSQISIEEINSGIHKLREYTRAHKRRSSSVRPTFDKEKSKKSTKKYISNIWELIEDWIDIVPGIPPLLDSFRSQFPDIGTHNFRDAIKAEFAWLRLQLAKVDSPIVSAHCDLLSGNIIIPNESLLQHKFLGLPSLNDNPIKFIDYEYMLPAPRAFDIANHLAEWQGFDCDRSAIPEPSTNNPVLVNWCKAYLNDEQASHEVVESLINEIYAHYGVPGFYWGIWAAIQSELSNIDFDYANYSNLRLQEYWDWKESYRS